MDKPQTAEKKVYQGWIVIEEAAPGYKPQVLVEWQEGTERKRQYMQGRGESAVAEALDWWDLKMGCRVLAEATIRGCYRIYTLQ